MILFFPLQMILAIRAWRRGWRWRAFLPSAIAIAMSVLLAIPLVQFGVAHRDMLDDMTSLGSMLSIVIHSVASIWLLRMATRPRPAPGSAPGPPSALSKDLAGGPLRQQ